MSIRGRLLALAIGGVVPLLIVGLTVLWVVWSGKQQQLNESLEQQAELAAVVFDRWLDAQYQPLITIASYPPNHLNDPSALEGNLKAALIDANIGSICVFWTQAEELWRHILPARRVFRLALPTNC